MAGRQVKGTLEGFALWAVERYARLTGKKEGSAVTALVDRWLQADAAYLERLGITLEKYWESEGIEPVEKPPGDRTERQPPAEPKKPN